MPIKSTAQTIHLTCDLCQTIHDRIPVTEGVWYEIAKAGWVLNRKDEKCICPDCIYAQHEQLVEVTAVEQLEPFKGYLVYVDCPHYWYWSGFRQLESRFSRFQGGYYGVPAYRDTNHDGVHSMSAVTDHMLEGGPIKIRFATAAEAAVIEMSYGMPMVIKEESISFVCGWCDRPSRASKNDKSVHVLNGLCSADCLEKATDFVVSVLTDMTSSEIREVVDRAGLTDDEDCAPIANELVNLVRTEEIIKNYKSN